MKSRPTLAPALIFSETVIREAGTGKLTIVNSFQKFSGPTLPFAVPPFIVTVSLAGFAGKGDHQFSIEMSGPTGENLVPPIPAEVETEAAVSPTDVFEFSFTIPAVQFQEAGAHEVVLKIGGEIAARRVLPVALIPPLTPLEIPRVAEAPASRASDKK